MEDIAQGVLAGIALRGFAATMFEVNLFALKALWHVNRLATKTVWEMFLGTESKQLKRERRQRVNPVVTEGVDRQQLERELRELWELLELRQAAAENSET